VTETKKAIENDTVQRLMLEAKMNAALRWDVMVMVIVNPVVNELRVEIVKLREEIAALREELCL